MRRVVAILFLYPVLLFSQVHDLSSWKIYPVPVNGDSIARYAYDENDWFVFSENQKVFATNYSDNLTEKNDVVEISDSALTKVFRLFPAGKRTFLKIDDGFLIGVFNGQFRGGLFWMSADLKHGYQISSQKIIKLIKAQNSLFAIQSFPNLEVSKGNLLEISKVNEKYFAKDYLDLPSAPIDIVTDSQDNLIILTASPSDLILVDKKKEVKTISANNFWEDLFPRNIIFLNGNIYIGMHKGVLKFNPDKGVKEWLMPN